ncbi:MAG: sodium:solute symporter family transporter [Pirellulaceae bacterium]
MIIIGDMHPGIRLQTVDWLVIGFYFVTLLIIGLYYRRFAGRSLTDYFLAGRRNSGWANGVSYAASLMNADVAPAYSGFVVATGLFVCWFYISRFGLALFIGAMLFAVFWRRLRLFTTPEFYELRFGGTASSIIRTWVALRCSLLAMVAWTGTGLLAIYKISEPVLGISKTTAIAMVVPVVLAYVGIAGLSGVVAAAGVQTIIMVVGSAMLCGIVLYGMGGPLELAAQLAATASPHVLEVFPPGDHWFFPLAAGVAWMIGTSIGYGGDTAPLGGAMEGQMVLSSRSSREASKMYVVAEVTLFLMLLLVTLPSLGAIVQWPELLNPEVDREKAYGLLMARHLPAGMLGLLFVVMLAAVMSTIGGNLIFGAQVLVSDVYRRYLRPNRTDRHYTWVGRAAALLILALGIVVAGKVDLIWRVAAFMVAVSAAELPANWAQWWWWRFNRWGRLAASIGGVLIPVLVWLVLPTKEWPWWERTYTVMIANTILWVVVTLATPPDSPETLERFYLKARPLGAWSPVRLALFAAGRIAPRGEGGGWGLIGMGLILAILGAVSVALLVTGLSCAYVGQYVRAGGLCLGAVIAGNIFLARYGRYLDSLEAWTDLSIGEGPAGGAAETNSEGVQEECGPQPAPTSVVVALSTTVFGLVLAAIGLSGSGTMRSFNLIAGLLMLLSAAAIGLLGRASAKTEDSSAGS